MNAERCALLHNEIVKLGWEGSGRDLDDLPQRNWFEFYGDEANEIRNSLSPTLGTFLEQAWEVGDDHSFFYYVMGLSHPSNLFINHSEEKSRGEKERFLTLYAANDIAEHPGGLIFDQNTDTAIIQMTVEDGSTIHNGRQLWYPLETVLEAWLDMIHVGKIRAVTGDVEGPNPKFDPWINIPYSDKMLQETISVFNQLVEAIESRMPGTHQEPSATGLVDDVILRESQVPPGFAYEFIRNVRRPRFQYVAPGLALPTPSTFSNQVFFSILPDPPPDDDDPVLAIAPILLFRSTQNYTAPPDADITGYNLPFSWPYSQVSQYPSGLYLSPVDRESSNPFEDECTLVLPFGIGANGFARTSDGARFGENTEAETSQAKDTFADLFQPGYQPFVEMHGARFVGVLKSWLAMVENGDWSVNEEGIIGGMDEWRKADTAPEWEKYVVPVGW
ncbi:uncharacterized protein BDR25DRAFT_219499 [Lindgomyces ingoldianus]|uniref:Uncharacterized protein n=1 Tax=Lindgomyces ingoldianus TaxID=673940 RepID=A0ACB6R100_9PLEO|nr:uncharacterized protein BDR25DRAFT_219499 [Lindgomyces ingoldianus]KAF2472770.1 hypothetical protein BDR25DRAFT_219499 [Lindgomyces ingoldianus]